MSAFDSKLPWTGQTTCYDTSGQPVPCRGSGQDGELRRGVPWPQPRFEVLGDEVLDRLTGLVWTRDANPFELPITWSEALERAAALNTGGAAGTWRLPNRLELRSLLSHDTRRPALPARHPFINVTNTWYWSSTTAAIHPSYAWYVHMDGARTFYGRKDEDHLVWPVRAGGNGIIAATGQTVCHDASGRVLSCGGTGQDGDLRMGRPWPQPRFEVEGVTVIDHVTDLVWTRSADLAQGEVSWAVAIATVERLRAESSGAEGAARPELESASAARTWRLPNILELESLVDCSAHSPALSQGHPFTDVRDDYWSSTTSMFEPDWAWALYLTKGAVGVGQKKGRSFFVWAVRDRFAR